MEERHCAIRPSHVAIGVLAALALALYWWVVRPILCFVSSGCSL